MRHETAILSALFPSVLKYTPDLINSLAKQTVKDFDWIVINDSLDPALIDKQVSGQFKWKNLQAPGLKPAQNRIMGIDYCKRQRYQYIIFQDADDWMSTNRVENCFELLSKEPVIFNDLNLVKEDGDLIRDSIWTNRLKTNQAIQSAFIENKNCIGLGNAAIRTNIIKQIRPIPNYVVAVDWFLFYYILQEAGALFSNGSKVFYRQYENNSAGINLITEKRIKKCLEVKRNHYTALMSDFPFLKKELDVLKWFEAEIVKRPEKLKQYILNNQDKSFSSFWWEETNFAS